jgi:hypothetical protein
MSKKSRRARAKIRSAQPARPAENRQSDVSRTLAAREGERRPASVAASVVAPVSHAYVRSDLIRIGIIVGALIIVIIVLTFLPALQS